MNAILQVSVIVADTRRAKEIRFLGIPVFIRREMNVKTVDEPRRIGPQAIEHYKKISKKTINNTNQNGTTQEHI